MFAIITAVGHVQPDHVGVKPRKMVSSQKYNKPVILLCVNFIVMFCGFHEINFKNMNMAMDILHI